MEASVASPDEGHGAIAMAFRRGRGVPPSQNTAVERRKASRLSLRPARAPSQEHVQYQCAFTALRSLYGGSKSKIESETRAEFRSEKK